MLRSRTRTRRQIWRPLALAGSAALLPLAACGPAAPDARTSYRQLDEMVPWYNFPGKSGTKGYKVVQDNIVATFNQEKTPQQALDEAAEECNRLINA